MVGLYVALATVITAQQTIGNARSNNFAIFRASFRHLVAGKDLYVLYPNEHWDLYKYSPTFALLFAPFSLLPYAAGLLCWNVLNAVVLSISVLLLLPQRAAVAALCIVLLETLGALQNTQSNALVAGLMVMSVVALERSRMTASALSVILGGVVKVYPLCAGMFGLLSQARWRYVLACAVIGLAFAIMPVIVTSPQALMSQYDAWFTLQRNDDVRIGAAWIGGLIEIALGHPIHHRNVQLIGIAWVSGSAFLVREYWTDQTVRRLLLASTLIFAVVFNHMAESPTFVIAFTGIGIWWASMPRERWRDALLLLIVLVGSVGGSDAAPKAFRQHIYLPYQLKAVVTILGWIAIQVDLFRIVRGVRTTAHANADVASPKTMPVAPAQLAR